MPWKLASHTVKLNRYQGTVEKFEALWTARASAQEAGEGALSGTWSGPHTPRSFRPLTPTCGSPLPFDSRNADSPTFPGARAIGSQTLHHQSVCSALNSAAAAGGANPLRARAHSDRTLFEMQSAPNQLLEALRFFELPLPEKHKPAFSWGTQQKDRLHLLARCVRLSPIPS